MTSEAGADARGGQWVVHSTETETVAKFITKKGITKSRINLCTSGNENEGVRSACSRTATKAIKRSDKTDFDIRRKASSGIVSGPGH